jgi:hypothetical protein
MVESSVTFIGTVHAIRSDADGETKLTLAIPASEIESVTAMYGFLGECTVKVTVEICEDARDDQA